jgi:hypothetical protein
MTVPFGTLACATPPPGAVNVDGPTQTLHLAPMYPGRASVARRLASTIKPSVFCCLTVRASVGFPEHCALTVRDLETANLWLFALKHSLLQILRPVLSL